MTLSEKQIIFTLNVAKLIQYIASKNYHCTLGEAFRTQEMANIYAQQGKGIHDSLHCKRLAIDINLISPQGIYLPDSKDYAQFGQYWKTLHPLNEWGGDWGPTPAHPHQNVDGNHFEMEDL